MRKTFFVVSFVFVFLCACYAGAQANLVETYELVDTWTGYEGIVNFGTIGAFAVDGDTLLASIKYKGSNRVYRFSPDGDVLHYFDTGTVLAQGIAVDASGNIYCSFENHRIRKYTSEGKYLWGIGTDGIRAGEFKNPNGILVHPNGYIYVVDTGNLRIQKFTANGKFVTQFGYDQFSGFEDYECEPHSIAVGTDGNLYVGTCDNGIYIFSADGSYLDKIYQNPSCNGSSYSIYSISLAIDANNNLFVPVEWYINSGYKSGILNLSSGGACNLIEGTEMSGGAESIKALAVRAISQTSQELFVAVQA
ncbi:MAG: NHL repeat-containing protein, partial [Desulfobacterota bacterium]|nr:NHL repeat-containing protein [Thermodesulfobacteriota bacterium]